jgi:tetratricopeptide (TPR) repeat protein
VASLIETLTSLHVDEFTGKITVQKEQVTKIIYFRKGTPVFVESNVRSETLGQLLLEKGKIDEERYRTILERMESTGRRQGEIIVELGFLSAFEVYEALKSQVHVKFENTFMLEGAEIVAEEGEQFLIGITDTPVDFFRAYLDFFQDWVTEPDLGRFPPDKALSLSAKGRNYLSGRSLHGKELKVVRLLNGRQTLHQILESSPGEETPAFAIVEGLNVMKFIDLVDPLPQRFQRSAAEITSEKALPKEETTTPGARVVDLTEPASPKKGSPIYTLALQLDQPYPKLLQLPAQANRFQVKKAFDEMVRQYHLDAIPETYKGEEQKLAEAALNRLTLAFTVFSDDKRRHEYLQALGRHEAPKEPAPKVKAEVALQKAHLFIAKKKFDEAEAEIRKAIELDPEESTYHVDLAELLMARATSQKGPLPNIVETELRLALKLNSADARAFFQIGVFFKVQDDLEKARNAFQKVLEIRPNDNKANTELRLINKRLESRKSEISLLNLFKKKK